jgi:hypothetical protein
MMQTALVNLVVIMLVMFALWIFSTAWRDVSIVDPVWELASSTWLGLPGS